jgi:hypothetical protein
MITESDLRNILRHRCEEAGGQGAWAKSNGFALSFVQFVLAGERRVSARIAKALGYNRSVVFFPCNSDPDVE